MSDHWQAYYIAIQYNGLSSELIRFLWAPPHETLRYDIELRGSIPTC